eukprot:4867412-Alexandrium_andersonii.AAC.2
MASDGRSDSPHVPFALRGVCRALNAANTRLPLLKLSLGNSNASAGLEDSQHGGMCFLYKGAVLRPPSTEAMHDIVYAIVARMGLWMQCAGALQRRGW